MIKTEKYCSIIVRPPLRHNGAARNPTVSKPVGFFY